MSGESHGAASGLMLVLNHDDLLLLEALTYFHARASTSAQLRARLTRLGDLLGRARIAASAAQTVRGRAAYVRGGPADGSAATGAGAAGS
jgi:hypothetical protein